MVIILIRSEFFQFPVAGIVFVVFGQVRDGIFRKIRVGQIERQIGIFIQFELGINLLGFLFLCPAVRKIVIESHITEVVQSSTTNIIDDLRFKAVFERTY